MTVSFILEQHDFQEMSEGLTLSIESATNLFWDRVEQAKPLPETEIMALLTSSTLMRMGTEVLMDNAHDASKEQFLEFCSALYDRVAYDRVEEETNSQGGEA